MRLLIEVYDASGNRIGDGPITSALSASVTRQLSGAGSIQLSFPAADYRAVSLLTNQRRVKLYTWSPEKRLLGEGIARQIGSREDSSGKTLTVSGPDLIDELKYANTWLAWQRQNASVSSIIRDLAALVPGWDISTSGLDGLDPLTIRMDGVSALKGMQDVIAQKGVHFRLGQSSRTLEFGVLGESNGLTLIAPGQVPLELEGNPSVALIERIEFVYDSEAVANRIVVLGPGDVEAAISLKYATKSSPYQVQSFSANGKTLYKIEDAGSIGDFGAIEKVFRASNVSAISNTPTDLEFASNALYDLAAAWLSRYAVRQEVYRVTVRKAAITVRPGDKLRVQYQGFAVNENDVPIRWVNLRGDYWVTGVSERFGADGLSLDLELSNIDRVAVNAAQVVLGAIEDLRSISAVVKPYLNKDTIAQPSQSIDSTHDVRFPLTFGLYTLRINQVIFRLKTRPFRANITGAASGGGSSVSSAAGGDHRHQMLFFVGGGALAYNNQNYVAVKSDLSGITCNIPVQNGETPGDIYTNGASGDHQHTVNIPNHTHNPVYGIYDDSTTPVSVRVYVDSVEVAGGPWSIAGGNLDLELDITTMFNENSFHGAHEIKVTCASGQGQVFGEIEVRETIQNLRVI